MSRPEQLALLDDPIDARFRAYHHRNPEVYRELRRLAFEWLAAGGRRCSIAMLFEVARWQRGVRAERQSIAVHHDHGRTDR